MASFPLGIASKPSNITDGLQILAAHVGAAWDEIVAMEAELLAGGTGQLVLDIRPASAGSVILQSRQNAGDTQARFQLTAGGDHKWGSGTAATDVTLARTATRTLTLTGSEVITPGNLADTALLIKGIASQAGLLLDVQDSTAASKMSVNAAGTLTAITVAATTAMTAPTKAPGTNTTDVATTAFVTAAVTAATPSSFVAGMMMPWAGSAAPSGWLLCDGSAVSRATFATLFAAISTDYGAGDGSTTFNLPDPRGKAVIGAGTGSGLTNRVRATTGGAETVTLAVGNLPSHDHGGATTGATATGATASTTATGTIANSAAHTHHMEFFTDWNPPIFASGSTNNQNRLSYNGTGGGGVIQSEYLGDIPMVFGDTDTGGIHSHTFTGTGHTHTVSVNSHTHPIPAQGSGTAHSLMSPWLATNYIIKT